MNLFPSEIPPPRILLVGADDTFRESSASILRKAGYCPDCEAEAGGAWTAICERGYGLLLVEQRLSGASGLRLILRMSHAHLILPVVLVIDAALPFDPQTHRHLRSLVVLARPFDAEQLLATVLATLQGAQASQPVRRTSPLIAAGYPPPPSGRRSLQRTRPTPRRRTLAG
jgi:DNA-binding response OmpR family regulator